MKHVVKKAITCTVIIALLMSLCIPVSAKPFPDVGSTMERAYLDGINICF